MLLGIQYNKSIKTKFPVGRPIKTCEENARSITTYN